MNRKSFLGALAGGLGASYFAVAATEKARAKPSKLCSLTLRETARESKKWKRS
jgi:hypothetical protein